MLSVTNQHGGINCPSMHKIPIISYSLIDFDVSCYRKNQSDVSLLIAQFTVACLVARSFNESETGGDLVLIETSLLFLC